MIISPETASSYALADKHTPKMQRAWLDGIASVGEVIERVVRDALTAYYNPYAAMTAIEASPEVQQAYTDMSDELGGVMLLLWADTEKASSYARKQKPELIEEAVAYAAAESGEMITALRAGQREAIQSLIQEGVENGMHPRVIARDVRKLGIGLAERGPHTYARVRRYMEAQMAAGVPDRLINARVKRFHDKLVKQRAESIAHTEMIKTQSEARRRMWDKELKEGLIDSRAERVWVAGVGDRTCQECVDMDGETAKLGQPYEEGVMGPPLHPRCRCTEMLRLK